MSVYDRGSKVFAMFRPKRVDNLRPEMEEFVGRRFLFRYAWTMDDGDPYPGQVAWLANEFGYWVPHEDLLDVEDAPEWAWSAGPAGSSGGGIRTLNEMRALCDAVRGREQA